MGIKDGDAGIAGGELGSVSGDPALSAGGLIECGPDTREDTAAPEPKGCDARLKAIIMPPQRGPGGMYE